MRNGPEIPADWTKPERWAWERIADGDAPDLNARGPDPKKLDPRTEVGWGDDRRLRVKFIQDILTRRALVDATPHGGVRILGALIDDAPLNLEHARLRHQFWLEESRILVAVQCRRLRVDGGVSFEGSFAASAVDLTGADIRESVGLSGATFEGDVSLGDATVVGSALMRRGSVFRGRLHVGSAKIGANVEMSGSTFEGDVNLSGAAVGGSAFLRAGATFRSELNLGSVKIGSQLEMDGSTFEGRVSMSGATVGRSAFLRRGAAFKRGLVLTGAAIGSNVEMYGSTFDGDVSLNRATVGGAVLLHAGATFRGGLDMKGAKIGSSLEMNGSTFAGSVDLSGCSIAGDLRLGASESSAAHWKDGASLTLRNTRVGALQDWRRNESANAWPKSYRLEGFTYDRLGSISAEKEGDMLARPAVSYIQWLSGDPGSSPQPYEHLARCFQRVGQPYKASDVLYAARERRRRKAWLAVDDHGRADWGEQRRALGLLLLRMTIGYGLGARYFRALWWVGGLTALGAVLLICFGSHTLDQWQRVFYASLDQLLPIVTLDKAHDALIFGDLSAKPPVEAQPYGVVVYFYWHKIAGWVLGSFLIAGLAGLTQRN